MSEIKIVFIDIETGRAVHQVLVGRPVKIEIHGLPAASLVSLKCSSYGCHESHATYSTGSSGTIDTSVDAPISGTYTGIESDGLFWSAIPILPQSTNADISLFHCKVFVEEVMAGEATLEWLFKLPGVETSRVTSADAAFEGLWSIPQGEGPFPALIVLGGSEGGLDTFSSPHFASLGYATLTIGYHRMPGLPDFIRQIPLEYFKNALQWLKSQSKVKSEKVALFGVSRGAELALLLSSYYDEFAAVVSVSGSGVAWAGNSEPGMKERVSSWCFNGQDIPSVAFHEVIPKEKVEAEEKVVMSYSPQSLDALNGANALAAVIPVDQINAPILFLAGDSDSIWPADRLTEIAVNRRKQFGVDKHDVYCLYKNAGHVLGVPGYPTTELTFFHPALKEWWSVGGTPEGNARAQRECWREVIQFLGRQLKNEE